MDDNDDDGVKMVMRWRVVEGGGDENKAKTPKTAQITTADALILNSLAINRLAGLVVKASASGAEDPGFESYQ